MTRACVIASHGFPHPLEVKPEWLVAAVMATNEEDAEIVTGKYTKTELMGYGVEIWLFATFTDIEKIPY